MRGCRGAGNHLFQWLCVALFWLGRIACAATEQGDSGMIEKPYEERAKTGDRFRDAGNAAEARMAFYLHRAFRDDPDFLVLNDLRLVDPEQPEHNGAPGVAQIDHLVLHRWGMFIIESKSVSDSVTVRGDASTGDEWTRLHQGRYTGIPSPIRQAEFQGRFLRSFLQRHRQELLGKVPLALRPLAFLINKTDQRGFMNLPMQIIVAISDNGKIDRKNGWEPPSEPFRTYVCKADQVDAKIREEYEKHRAASGLLSRPDGGYGIWWMEADECKAVTDFLKEQHTNEGRRGVSAQKPAATRAPAAERPKRAGVGKDGVCRECKGEKLTAHWGKGYYWKCQDCGASTTMPTVCSSCGAKGDRGKGVRIRKDGERYERVCEGCGCEELVWSG